MDTEHVVLEADRYTHVAATVGIVNYWGKEWDYTIRHEPGSFMVNRYTVAITGFKSWSLMRGHELDWVRNQVQKLLQGKLVVLCDADPDFRALGLNREDFDVFDLQDFWRDANGRKYGLKNIYAQYFPDYGKFQDGVHSAVEDARVTMKIFRDVYIDEFRPVERYTRLPTDCTFSRVY